MAYKAPKKEEAEIAKYVLVVGYGYVRHARACWKDYGLQNYT